jgi:hypothetical protein
MSETLYFYHPKSGLLVGTTKANEITPGNFEVPAHSTLIKPPNPVDNYKPCFNETTQEWTLKEVPQVEVKTVRPSLPPSTYPLDYKALRRRAYPPLEELADALYWQHNGDSSKMEAYLTAMAKVKETYPKPPPEPPASKPLVAPMPSPPTIPKPPRPVTKRVLFP